jgi:hypothetical protein
MYCLLIDAKEGEGKPSTQTRGSHPKGSAIDAGTFLFKDSSVECPPSAVLLRRTGRVSSVNPVLQVAILNLRDSALLTFHVPSLSEPGRDAFHRVPNSFRKIWGRVERVPTSSWFQRAKIPFGEVSPIRWERAGVRVAPVSVSFSCHFNSRMMLN